MVLTALRRSYPIDCSVDFAGMYLSGFVLKVEEMWTCWSWPL